MFQARICGQCLNLTQVFDLFCCVFFVLCVSPHYFINLVAKAMEAIPATEQEAVKGQVQTECNAQRDFFERTTTA